MALSQLPSEAQDEPGYCAFYEECGSNPLLENSGTLIEPIVPCLNSTRPPRLSGAHYDKLYQVMGPLFLKVWRAFNR